MLYTPRNPSIFAPLTLTLVLVLAGNDRASEDRLAERDDGCSVTSGYVYRSTAFPALQGAYLFGDYCSGRIWSLHRDATDKTDTWQITAPLQTDALISSFGVDEANELCLTDISSGAVLRVVTR